MLTFYLPHQYTTSSLNCCFKAGLMLSCYLHKILLSKCFNKNRDPFSTFYYLVQQTWIYCNLNFCSQLTEESVVFFPSTAVAKVFTASKSSSGYLSGHHTSSHLNYSCFSISSNLSAISSLTSDINNRFSPFGPFSVEIIVRKHPGRSAVSENSDLTVWHHEPCNVQTPFIWVLMLGLNLKADFLLNQNINRCTF